MIYVSKRAATFFSVYNVGMISINSSEQRTYSFSQIPIVSCEFFPENTDISFDH